VPEVKNSYDENDPELQPTTDYGKKLLKKLEAEQKLPD